MLLTSPMAPSFAPPPVKPRSSRTIDGRNRYFLHDEATVESRWFAHQYSPHSFRVAPVTDLLEQNVEFDDGPSYRFFWKFCPGFLPAAVG
jgi:hypothetical protein